MEKFWRKSIDEEINSPFYFLVRSFLCLSAYLFRAILAFRMWLYRSSLKKVVAARKACVISVGNISLGGVGKTPLTLYLASLFEASFKVAILTRGYRSLAEHKSEPVCIDCSQSLKYDYKYVGDEPILFSRYLKNSLIFVSKNRQKSLQQAEVQGAQLLLLDDGMQHIQVKRDSDIVVVDPDTFLGNQYLFPRGELREPMDALQRAQLIVFLSKSLKQHNCHLLLSQLQKFTKAPAIFIQLLFSDWIGGSIKNKKVALFCGVGRPNSFIAMVRSHAKEIVHQKILNDHVPFEKEEYKFFENEAVLKGAEVIVCTEKDFVKFNFNSCLPLLYPKTSLKIEQGAEILEEYLFKIKNKICSL